MSYDIGTARGVIQMEYNGRGVRQAKTDFSTLQKTGVQVGRSLGLIGAAGAGAGLAIVGALGMAIKTTADFEKQLSGIAAVSGATGDELDAIRSKALQLGADTVFSASEAASAMEELVKAGISVDDVLNGAADAAVALAAAGGIDIPEAATIASNAMNQFNLTAAQLPGVVDSIAGAANASAIDVSQLGTSLSQVGAVANLAGLSFEDTATAIALMGNAGIVGSDAGTSLKTMLQNLQPVTKKQIALFQELGITTADGANNFFDAEGNVKSYADISQVLSDALAGMTNAQKLATLETMFGTDAIRAAAVAADAGADGVNALNTEMGKTTAAEVAAKRMDNFSGSLEQLKGSLETAIITGGSGALVVLRAIVDALTEGVNTSVTMGKALANAVAPGFEDLWAAIKHVVGVAMEVWNIFDGIVEVVAKLTLGAVIVAFNALASLLELVTGLLDGQGAVIAIVAGTWLLLANGGIAAVLAKLGYFVAYAVVQTLAGMESIRVGAVATSTTLKGLAASASAASASLAAVALLVLAVQTWNAYKEAVEETTAALEGADKAKSSSNFTGIQEEIAKIQDLIAARKKFIQQQEEVAARGNVLEQAWNLPKSFKSGEYKDAMEDLQAASDDLADSLMNMGSSLADIAAEFGVIDPSKAQDLMDALAAGDPEALNDLNALLADMQPLLDQVGVSAEDFIQILNGTGDMTLPELRTALRDVADKSGTAAGATESLADAAKSFANDAKSAADAAKELDSALDALIGVELSADEATIKWHEGLRTLRAELAKTNGEIKGSSKVAEANRTLIIDSTRDLLARISAEAKAGASSKRLGEIFRDGKKALIDSAVAAGANREQVKALLREYNLTPEVIKTLIEAPGAEESTNQIKDLRKQIAELKPKAVEIGTPGAEDARRQIQELRTQIALLKGKQIVIDVIRQVSGMVGGSLGGGGGGGATSDKSGKTVTEGMFPKSSGVLPSPLPGASPKTRGRRGGGAKGDLRLVDGELRLAPSGRAFISGVAVEADDDGDEFDDLIGRMG